MSRWIIAGGGTGGHFFSGVAIADAVWAHDPDSQVVFVGTHNGIEGRTSERERLDIRYITVSGIKGKSLTARAVSMLRLPVALGQSMAILARVKPHVVLGVGGYASGPVLLAAWMMGIPTAVMEQNSVPGYTNSVLARLVDRVFVGFPEAAERFPGNKAVYTGNPIRRALGERLAQKGEADGDDLFRLLAFGGSQGAHHLNTAMVDAVGHLSDEVRDRLRLVHQTGPAELEQVRQGYADKLEPGAVDAVPFIDDMASAYGAADLVICRSGALTVAELTTCGRAAILVPFPHAIYNHQEINARSLSDQGAARLMLDADLDGPRLAGLIEELAAAPGTRADMATQARALARPDAGDEVVRQCLELAERSSR